MVRERNDSNDGGTGESENLLRARIEGLTAELRDKAKCIGEEDKTKFNKKQAEKMAASLTKCGLEIFRTWTRRNSSTIRTRSRVSNSGGRKPKT